MPALVLPLRHGLQLTITGAPTLPALANFLKAAMVHFKNQRDIQQVKVYTAGSFQGRVPGGDCAISHPGDSAGQHLPPAAWAEAVLDVYRRIEALQGGQQTTPWAAASTGQEHSTAHAAVATDQASPAAHLEALRAALEQRES